MKKWVLVVSILLIIGCSKENPPIEKTEYEKYNVYVEGEEYPIGKYSSSVYNSQAFGMLLPGMSRDQNIDFGLGDRLFSKTFVVSKGVGPRFNAKACSNCHFRDGRGNPLSGSTDIDGAVSRGFLIRLSAHGKSANGGPLPFPGYGKQLQDRGLSIMGGEAKVKVTYQFVKGEYPDGELYELRKPIYEFYDEQFGSLSDALFSPRVGTQTIGLGFVDALTESQLLENEDEFDSNNDGISGKANYVWNVREGKNTIGKFGWKANAPTIEQQVAGALKGDMGITTSVFPNQDCPSAQQDCNDYIDENGIREKVEMADEQLKELTFYQATLSVPTRRKARVKEIISGKAFFHQMDCVKCHQIGFKVQQSKMVPQIAGTVFNPYSDFLLHDMGDDLADNRPDFLASGREWRTQPLWGIGMIQTVNKHTNLLHDGRARNIEEAILWHGGEAAKAKQEFMNLSKKEREQVLKFINSL